MQRYMGNPIQVIFIAPCAAGCAGHRCDVHVTSVPVGTISDDKELYWRIT